MVLRRKIMIVAGEASGDGHAAKLVKGFADIEHETTFEFFGAAGPRMREVGVEAIVHSDDLSVVGVAEIALALPMFMAASRKLKHAALDRKPDVVVLVDFPDFNLRLAKWLKKRGFLVAYYISPQLWAWRKYRVSIIKKYVDLMLTILPFEKEWYRAKGAENVAYVGNPLTNEVSSSVSKEEFCNAHGLDPAQQIIALLPGSRHKEIIRMLPVMLQAAADLAAVDEGRQFVIPCAYQKNRVDVDNIISNSLRLPANLHVVENQTYDALSVSDAAVVTSGTATLETGIIGTPMVIVYRSSALNYVLLRPLISVEHYGLINLIAGERVAKELIQYDFSPKSVSAEVSRLLDPDINARVRAILKQTSAKLGQGGASKRAADAILKLIDEHK